ncbi:MAG: TolC family protein [Desulfuromonadales bacterium]|nr:TolC family protein [Desulfuromonadales bacterium]
MRIFLSSVLLLTLPFTACAASISLAEALRQGLQKNPGYLASTADTAAARAVSAQAASQRLPRLDLKENLLWTNEPGGSLFIALNQERLQLSPSADDYNYPPTRADFETRLQLTQPLYNPDIRYGYRQAKKQAAASEARQKADRETLLLEIFAAYLEVQSQSSILSWVESSIREADEILRLAAEKEKAGVGLKAETLSARVHLSESRRLKIQATNAFNLARRNLALILGSDEEALDIEAPVTVDLLGPPPAEQTLQRPDLQAIDLQRQSFSLAREQREAAWHPRINAAASWSSHDRDYPFSDLADSWGLHLGLSWVLYDGSSRQYAVNKALAEERSMAARQRMAERQALFDVEQARLEGDMVSQQLEVVGSSRAAAGESYRLLKSRYSSGLAPLSELLSAQSRLEKTRADLVSTELQLLYNLARQHYLLGSLSGEILGKEGTGK